MNKNVTYQDKWSENMKQNKNILMEHTYYLRLHAYIASTAWTVTSDYIWKEIAICELIRVKFCCIKCSLPLYS